MPDTLPTKNAVLWVCPGLWLQPPYRQPGLIKYLAGPEIGAGNFMADTMPEDKAAELLKVNLHDYALER